MTAFVLKIPKTSINQYDSGESDCSHFVFVRWKALRAFVNCFACDTLDFLYMFLTQHLIIILFFIS